MDGVVPEGQSDGVTFEDDRPETAATPGFEEAKNPEILEHDFHATQRACVLLPVEAFEVGLAASVEAYRPAARASVEDQKTVEDPVKIVEERVDDDHESRTVPAEDEEVHGEAAEHYSAVVLASEVIHLVQMAYSWATAVADVLASAVTAASHFAVVDVPPDFRGAWASFVAVPAATRRLVAPSCRQRATRRPCHLHLRTVIPSPHYQEAMALSFLASF